MSLDTRKDNQEEQSLNDAPQEQDNLDAERFAAPSELPAADDKSQTETQNAQREAEKRGEQFSLEIPRLGEFVEGLNNLFARDAKTGESQPEVKTKDGMTWKKSGDGWQLFDKDNKKVDSKYGDVTDVKREADGTINLQLKDNTSIKERPDGSRLTLNDKGQVTTLTYKDGTSREFQWTGDQLTGTKTRDGKWWDRAQGQNGYLDQWKPKGEQQSWNGKIEVDSATGDYSLTPGNGAQRGVKTTSRTDESKEVTQPDGSRQVTLPNKATLNYNAQGQITEFTAEDGTNRKFGWGKDAEGKDELKSITVRKPGGAEYKWENKDGVWSVNGEKSKNSFSLDNKTGEYTWTDGEKNETHKVKASGGEQLITADGTTMDLQGGKVVRSTKGDRSFEYSYTGSNISEVRETQDGNVSRTWKPGQDGKWTGTDSAGKTKTVDGTPAVTESGELSFNKGDSTSVFKFDGKEASRTVDKKTGTIIERTDNSVSVISGDGSKRQYQMDGDQVVNETRTRNGQVETWERQKSEDGKYTDTWVKKGTDEKEQRTDVKLNDAGQFSYTRNDGAQYTARADGTESLKNEKEKWSIEYKDGKASEITYPDGKVRKFTYNGNDVQKVEIKEPGSNTVSTWERIGKDKYKSGSGTEWNARIEVKRDSYEITDFDSDNKRTVRSPQGRMVEEFPKENRSVETINGVVSKITASGVERSFERDKDGKINQITDSATGNVYRKGADGKWEVLDGEGKPAPDGFERKGDVLADDKGNFTFLSPDGSLVKHEVGKDAQKISHGLELEKKIVDNANLTDKDKIRFLENIDKIQNNSSISDKEKKGLYSEITRLLDHKGEGAFNEKDRVKLAEQLAWHVANPEKDAQGSHPTCNVTDIRLCLERQTPSQLGKLIADVAITGQYKTQDGSTIKPSMSSLKPDAEASEFPPKDGQRTWLGKISDVTMANIYWQRRTTDMQGYVVQKGSMHYNEVTPTDRDDSGSRVQRYAQATDGKTYAYDQARTPSLHADNIMDVYRQITGKEETNRFIINGDHNRTGKGVTVVNSKEDLHKALSDGPWPKIIEVQNNILKGLKPDGKDHEHVVIVTGYDPKTGKVSVDNSHSSGDDMLRGDKQISLERLYEATKLRQSVQTYYQQQNYQQQNVYYNNNNVYYNNNNRGYYYNGGYRYYR